MDVHQEPFVSLDMWFPMHTMVTPKDMGIIEVWGITLTILSYVSHSKI